MSREDEIMAEHGIKDYGFGPDDPRHPDYYKSHTRDVCLPFSGMEETLRALLMNALDCEVPKVVRSVSYCYLIDMIDEKDVPAVTCVLQMTGVLDELESDN